MVKTFRAYLPANSYRKYSCVHCRAHLASHDDLISKVRSSLLARKLSVQNNCSYFSTNWHEFSLYSLFRVAKEEHTFSIQCKLPFTTVLLFSFFLLGLCQLLVCLHFHLSKISTFLAQQWCYKNITYVFNAKKFRTAIAICMLLWNFTLLNVKRAKRKSCYVVEKKEKGFMSHFRVNIACGPAEDRVLLTGLHAVADIYCKSCKTTLGWKYVSLFHTGKTFIHEFM